MSVTKLSKTIKKIWYPCGCVAYLEKDSPVLLSLCEQHHVKVWGCKSFPADPEEMKEQEKRD